MKIGPSNPDSPRIDGRTAVGDRASPARGVASQEPVSAPVAVDRVSLSGSWRRIASA